MDAKNIDEFRSYLQKKGYSLEAVKSYGNTIKNYLFINPAANLYRYKEVLASLEQKSYRPLKISARKTILIKVKKYYDYLLDTGQREDHPCRGLNLKGNM